MRRIEGVRYTAEMPCGCKFCEVHTALVIAMGKDWAPLTPPLTHQERHDVIEWEQELEEDR